MHYCLQVKKAGEREIEEIKEAYAKQIEEETQRITKHAQKMIEKAEADKQDVLIACHTESMEQVKKTIIECDAKVSRLHVRKSQTSLTNYSFSVNLCLNIHTGTLFYRFFMKYNSLCRCFFSVNTVFYYVCPL